MARIDVPFVIEKQHITQPTREKLVAGGKNYFYATFKVCEKWEDIDHIKAEFVREGVEPKLMGLSKTESGYECQIPWEVMADKGVFQVGIFGGDRLLTNYEYVIVLQGCCGEGGKPLTPTEDWFLRVENDLAEMKEEVKIVSEMQEQMDETVAATEIMKADVEGLQQQINEEAHFRGYLSTNAKIQSMEATPNDFAYSAESGTKWVYDAELGWQDTGTPVPDQLTPASDATPLVNGVATPGTSNEYARGDHRHPNDPTKVSFTDHASEDKAGVVKVKSNAHSSCLYMSTDGTLNLLEATEFDLGTTISAVITTKILEQAVKFVGDGYYAKAEEVGDISSALDELHAYAESLIGGAE